MFERLKTKDCTWSGSSKNKLQRRCFHLWFFPLSLPLSFTYYDVLALTLMLSPRKCCNLFIIIFIYEVQYYPPLPSPAMDSVLVNTVLSELFQVFFCFWLLGLKTFLKLLSPVSGSEER